MLIHEAMHARLSVSSAQDIENIRVRLPLSLKPDRVNVRTGMLQRLASSRLFTLGDRSGVLRAAQRRSGRTFRLDVRQRVIVKALVSRHVGKGMERTATLSKHLVYLGRSGAGLEGARPEFFTRDADGIAPSAETAGWCQDRHHFRFIVSPEHGDRIDDLRAYTREVMSRVSADLGEPGLRWIATCHFDTDQPHAHVLVRGRRQDGRDLVIPRDYMGYWFRARAQEVAQELLGDLTRVEAERRIWKETEADRFTGFDRRLLGTMDADRTVADGVGANDAWNALTRGRLRHLEALGLATRSGRRYHLDGDLELKLRGLQARRDIIRTMNQRRLATEAQVRPFGTDRIQGKVVKVGFYDEAGAQPWVIVCSAPGIEHLARLTAGAVARTGESIALVPMTNGLARVVRGRGMELGGD